MRDVWSWNIRHWIYWHLAQHDRRVHGEGPLLVAMGDSLTDPFSGCTFSWQVWLRHVARRGYKTVNLGMGGQTTSDMRQRIEDFLAEGTPDVAVVFAGSVDAERSVDPAETERNLTFIVKWLQEQGIRKIVLIGPGLMNLSEVPDYLVDVPDLVGANDIVRGILKDIAAQHDAVFVDLVEYLSARIARGDDPDFSRVPYRQSRGWHAWAGDAHFNAYGQRLVADAFFTATADWLPPGQPRRSLPVVGRRRVRPRRRVTVNR